MTDFTDSFSQAWRMIAAAHPDVMSAVRVSIAVSFCAAAPAACVAIPAGFALGAFAFRGKNAVAAALHTLSGVPTVVIGLVGYMLLTSHGPLGGFGWLYTTAGITFGLFLLIVPLMTSLCMSAAHGVRADVYETALALGASPLRAAAAALREGRFAYLTAVAMGFGRAVGEVGVAMMLGGNIRGATRTMTTAMALETDRGAFATALALGMILLAVALCVNAALHFLNARAGSR